LLRIESKRLCLDDVGTEATPLAVPSARQFIAVAFLLSRADPKISSALAYPQFLRLFVSDNRLCEPNAHRVAAAAAALGEEVGAPVLLGAVPVKGYAAPVQVWGLD
jgi:hypothetical protein